MFLQSQLTIKSKNLSSWSHFIPNWTLPFFQFGGMGMTYMILFLFHPLKFFKTINRAVFKKKPLTLLDHVIYSFFHGKKPSSNMPSKVLSSYPKPILAKAKKAEKVVS
jgi:hypothetical protein